MTFLTRCDDMYIRLYHPTIHRADGKGDQHGQDGEGRREGGEDGDEVY